MVGVRSSTAIDLPRLARERFIWPILIAQQAMKFLPERSVSEARRRLRSINIPGLFLGWMSHWKRLCAGYESHVRSGSELFVRHAFQRANLKLPWRSARSCNNWAFKDFCFQA